GRLVFGRGGGKLAYGGKVGTSFDGASPRADDVAASMVGLYPSFRDKPVTHSWMGPIDRTQVGLPFFSRLGGREDIVYGVGYSGNGVGPTYLGGKILARSEEHTSELQSRFDLVCRLLLEKKNLS